MCIAVFGWEAHPLFPFLLLLNRDEHHNRPTKALGWWEDGEILGGRDEVAGGTWLACTPRSGRIAFLTNVRELNSLPLPPRSRGELPLRFLKSNKTPMDFAEELAGETDPYQGFNLVIGDFSSKTMVYVTNRPKDGRICTTEVSPGIHVLSNAQLDTPWPKAQKLKCGFKDMLDSYVEGGGNKLNLSQMAEKLMKDTTVVDDESLLPHIYPVEFEYHLSSIFVEAETPTGRYGTVSTSAVSMEVNGDVSFYQNYLENETWKEQNYNFKIGIV